MQIATKTGDDGTTGLFYGGRVAKNSAAPSAYGSVDEAQAAIGLARAVASRGGRLDEMLTGICKDLYVAMAELATAEENRHKLAAGASLVTSEMVVQLDTIGAEVSEYFEMPTEFVIPGQTEIAARLDVARTLVRRAERDCLAAVHAGSEVIRYLNRLSDVMWTLARWQEGHALEAKTAEGLLQSETD